MRNALSALIDRDGKGHIYVHHTKKVKSAQMGYLKIQHPGCLLDFIEGR